MQSVCLRLLVVKPLPCKCVKQVVRTVLIISVLFPYILFFVGYTTWYKGLASKSGSVRSNLHSHVQPSPPPISLHTPLSYEDAQETSDGSKWMCSNAFSKPVYRSLHVTWKTIKLYQLQKQKFKVLIIKLNRMESTQSGSCRGKNQITVDYPCKKCITTFILPRTLLTWSYASWQD